MEQDLENQADLNRLKTEIAPGQPGISPTWTSSAKDIVGCALGSSRIWFTLGFGILNEIYYPRVDIPQIRDLGFIVADGHGFWVEVKRLESYALRLLAPGSPVVEVIHKHPRFRLSLRIVPASYRDVLMIDVALEGDEKLLPYVLVAPRLGATGQDNIAEVSQFAGRTVLGASQGPFALAVAATSCYRRDGICQASVGYVGESDGWQDFYRNGALTWRYTKAGPGNVAMIATLPRQAILAAGFGASVQAAATLANSALAQPFDRLLSRQLDLWQRWHSYREKRAMLLIEDAGKLAEQFRMSMMVLRAHCDKTDAGAMVASLSVPWGNSRDDRAGYHLVWPRDLYHCATALLATGAEREARDTLCYLIATQNADGSWHQNQWLGGTPYWQGIQLDEIAAPVLLAAALAERNALHGIEVADMVRRALSFIARTGPSSPQDRWEETPGLNAYTLAQCIAAFVAGSQFLAPPARKFALMLADYWNANLENWLKVEGTDLCKALNVDNYCIHVAPAGVLESRNSLGDLLDLKNQTSPRRVPAEEEVSNDFLQLVRFGLRQPDDPWIANSIRVADALLKVETPNGPTWHRYNGDGYGEDDDGQPFLGAGRGRAWPLLTGERGHYALVGGRDPFPYLEAMASMAGRGGMIPEQVWDSAPIPERRLFPGCPTGSAMPLAWAHAEFLKLLISQRLGHPVDRPQAVWTRYGGQRPRPDTAIWCLHAPIDSVCSDQSLIIATNQPSRVHWGRDGWQYTSDAQTQDTGLGLHIVSIGQEIIGESIQIDFTIQAHSDLRWVGKDFQIIVVHSHRQSRGSQACLAANGSRQAQHRAASVELAGRQPHSQVASAI